MSIIDKRRLRTTSGSERNIWHESTSDQLWYFCQGAPDVCLDGWYTPKELREIADYVEKFQVKS